jgi:DNA polymerase-4
MRHYAQISAQIREVFETFTDRIEPLSLDEAYLDVAENKRGEPLASRLAKQIKREIRERTGLVASAGVGPCKLVAKIASDLDKPDGLLVVAPDQVLDFLAPLPVTRIWGVGPATAERLSALGVKTIADVRRLDAKLLEQRFGKYGVQLLKLAHGDDTREVEARTRRKSCGSETTFAEDVLSASELCHVLKNLCEDVAAYLSQHQIRARTVTIKLRYDDFTTITRSRSVTQAISSGDGLYEVAELLLLGSTEAGQRPVRLIGVAAGTLLAAAEPEQLWFDWSRM